MSESRVEKQIRAAKVVQRLKEAYPDSKCSLNYRTTCELLIATILSAQCTDRRVNRTTGKLFQKYRSPADFAYANPEELAEDIHSCGYHNQKARNIRSTCLKIVEEYNGKVPETLEELIKLPGVGRKTANCVLGECFGVPSLVIDTHMVRIMNLLGFTQTRNPARIEQELMDIFDRKEWVKLTHRIIDHGRNVCIARKPQCNVCVLSDLCPSAQLT